MMLFQGWGYRDDMLNTNVGAWRFSQQLSTIIITDVERKIHIFITTDKQIWLHEYRIVISMIRRYIRWWIQPANDTWDL